jgi:PDZ domain-containing protein
MKRPLSRLGLGILFALGLAGAVVPLPFYSEEPGPAQEVGPLIHVDGHQRHETGRLVMTTVTQSRELSALQLLLAWLDPDERVVGRDELLPPGTSAEQEQRRALAEMDTSKIDATYVALYRLTSYPLDHGPGALVESVAEECPAEGSIFAGDVILSIAGEEIDSREEASGLLARQPAGKPFQVVVEAAGETHRYTVRRERCIDGAGPVLGVSLVETFPFEVTIESGEVGGPSAGLMYALGLYDLLTPGDLTGGRTVAGTGSIDLYGRVGAIGGVREKVAAARRVGASVFLVPEANYEEALPAAGDGIELIPVGTLQDALAYLDGGTTP